VAAVLRTLAGILMQHSPKRAEDKRGQAQALLQPENRESKPSVVVAAEAVERR